MCHECACRMLQTMTRPKEGIRRTSKLPAHHQVCRKDRKLRRQCSTPAPNKEKEARFDICNTQLLSHWLSPCWHTTRSSESDSITCINNDSIICINYWRSSESDSTTCINTDSITCINYWRSSERNMMTCINYWLDYLYWLHVYWN